MKTGAISFSLTLALLFSQHLRAATGCQEALEELAATGALSLNQPTVSIEAIETVFSKLTNTTEYSTGELGRIIYYAGLAAADPNDPDKIPLYPDKLAERLNLDPGDEVVGGFHMQLAGILELNKALRTQRDQEMDELVTSNKKPKTEDVIYLMNRLWPAPHLLRARALLSYLKNQENPDAPSNAQIRNKKRKLLDPIIHDLVKLDGLRLKLALSFDLKAEVDLKSEINMDFSQLNAKLLGMQRVLNELMIEFGSGIQSALIQQLELSGNHSEADQLRRLTKPEVYNLGLGTLQKTPRLFQEATQLSLSNLVAAAKDGRLEDLTRELAYRTYNPHQAAPEGGWLALAGDDKVKKFLELYLLNRWEPYWSSSP